MRSHLPSTAMCDRIFPPQLDVIAFSHHSYLRSHFPTTARCDRIFLPQLDAIAFFHHSPYSSTDSRLPIPYSRLPIPDSRFPTPDSRLPIPNSRILNSRILNSLLPTPYSLLPIPRSAVVSPVQRGIFLLALKIPIVTGYSTEKQRKLLPKYHLKFLKHTIAVIN
ncbi:MAG: hypothetical protein F6J90_07525 [Moorea sp. SIOASIH]|uniref:hypothetical protein n=1 Tax=Moorena sp. SIOASIH TaxID=2607817 RepID=UPI0013B6FECC|nr:hypothetical protein [Moorena sp. SIOASIH]NEO36182.1 hypothetical protein [Moorena sp. SIOASIH]